MDLINFGIFKWPDLSAPIGLQINGKTQNFIKLNFLHNVYVQCTQISGKLGESHLARTKLTQNSLGKQEVLSFNW